MLKGASLKLRAALVFSTLYAALFVGGFVVLAWKSLSTDGEAHHSGPTILLALAEQGLQFADGRIVVPSGGALERFARKNPSMWLLASTDGEMYAYGHAPPAARSFVRDIAGHTQTARFFVPGVGRPFADASAIRRGGFVLAGGGVDPATVSLLDTLQYAQGEGLGIVLVAFGALGVLGLLVALPLLAAAFRPLMRDAAQVGPEHPDRRLDLASTPRELLPLVRSFNAALDRLADELGRRRRFIVDVAHEMRTPLAIMSLQVESLPAGEDRTSLNRVTTRLSHLVGQMLDVERLSLSAREARTIDLGEIAREVVCEMAPMALAEGYELSLERPGVTVPARGDPHASGRAVANLVGNAIAHGGGAGDIHVVVALGRTIDVVDAGPGVPTALRDHVFEPFSRERWDRDGCGMGLHLAREIMRAHGGDAELLETEGGATFRLSFAPAPEDGSP